MKSQSLSADAGEIIAVHDVRAFVTVNVCAEQALLPILGRSRFTVAFTMALSCVPLVPSRNVPLTQSLAHGDAVPIPTFVPSSVSAPVPRVVASIQRVL